MISRHLLKVGTGRAAEPDTMRRVRLAPRLHRRWTFEGAASQARIRRPYTVGTAMKRVTSPDAKRSHTATGAGSPNSHVAPDQRAQHSALTIP